MRGTFLDSEEVTWVVVSFRIPSQFVLKRFKGDIRSFHRILSNGQNCFNGVSNRSFWKKIKDGFYRYSLSHHFADFVYFLQVEKEKQNRTIKELEIRIRKIYNTKVEIKEKELMDEVDRLMLSLPKGFSNYKRVKLKSQKKQKKEGRY
jgi:hypothetical protein